MPVKEYTSTGDESVWTLREVMIVALSNQTNGTDRMPSPQYLASRCRCSVPFVLATLRKYQKQVESAQFPQR